MPNCKWQAKHYKRLSRHRKVFIKQNNGQDRGEFVSSSPGVQDLERARSSMQSGNYGIVLELSRVAAAAAQTAIAQAEREIARRRMEEQLAAERARRARDAARQRANRNFGGSIGGGIGDLFGSGRSGFGSGFGGGSSSSSSRTQAAAQAEASAVVRRAVDPVRRVAVAPLRPGNSGFSRSGCKACSVTKNLVH